MALATGAPEAHRTSQGRGPEGSPIWVLPGAGVGLVEPDCALWYLDMATFSPEFPQPPKPAHLCESISRGAVHSRGVE